MKTSLNQNNTTIFLEGTLTKYNFSKLLENAQELMKMRNCEIILNCIHLKTIDSIGLGTIISLAETAHLHGKKLYLVGLNNTTAESSTTMELKEYISGVLDISNKVNNNCSTNTSLISQNKPALKRV